MTQTNIMNRRLLHGISGAMPTTTRTIDHVLYTVRMRVMMSSQGYAYAMETHLLRLRLFAVVIEATAKVGCLSEGPPSREYRPDLAKTVDEMSRSLETIKDFVCRPVSLNRAYRIRLEEYEQQAKCILTQDIPNVSLKRDAAARQYYVSGSHAVLQYRLKLLAKLINDDSVHCPQAEEALRIAKRMRMESTFVVEDVVRRVGGASLLAAGEIAFAGFFSEYAISCFLPVVREWQGALRGRRKIFGVWGSTDLQRSIDGYISKSENDIRYVCAFGKINPRFAYELLLDAVEELVVAARLLP